MNHTVPSLKDTIEPSESNATTTINTEPSTGTCTVAIKNLRSYLNYHNNYDELYSL